MNLFKFKSIRLKMLFGFSLVLVLVILSGIYNYFSVNKVNEDTENMANEQIPLLVASEKLAFNTAQRLATVRGYIIFGEQEYIDLFNGYTEESKEYQDKILELTDSETVEELVDKSVEWRVFINDKVIEEYKNGN